MKKVKIKLGDHFAVLGGTGSGKTTFSKKLILEFALATQGKIPIYILDSKISGDFKEFHKKGVGILYQGNSIPPIHDVEKFGAFQIWQPEEDDFDLYNEWLKQIYQTRQPCIVFFDELSSICKTNGSPPRYYEILLKQGRGNYQSIISCTQSPSYVPPSLLRQVMHVIRFRLNFSYDVKKIMSVMGKKVEEEPVDDYGFYYRNVSRPIQSSPVVYYNDLKKFF